MVLLCIKHTTLKMEGYLKLNLQPFQEKNLCQSEDKKNSSITAYPDYC